MIFAVSPLQQALFVHIGRTAHRTRVQPHTACFQCIHALQLSHQLLLKRSIPLIVGEQTQHTRQSVIRHIQRGQVHQSAPSQGGESPTDPVLDPVHPMIGRRSAHGSTRPGSVRPCSVLCADHGSERTCPTGSPTACVAYASTRAEYRLFVPFPGSRLLSFASVSHLFVFASRLKRTVSYSDETTTIILVGKLSRKACPPG